VEKVDRKSIITAETLMFKKNTVVEINKEGPKGVLRKMRAVGLDILPVEDDSKKFLGYVWVQDILKLEKAKETTIEKALKTEVPSVYKNYTVEEMLPLITGIRYPVAVVDEDSGRLLGIVSQTSLIIEATRYEMDEVMELKEKANEI